ncbi:hypothetical protein [Rufibacter sp. LB8]|uniref:hypothetical protein n=1 Tax=Rufibacter sp. LB8 TaxID=2777781 RepID=UPI00178C7DD0|nr:hypothetical protein [Rufibacter sp. LB8]
MIKILEHKSIDENGEDSIVKIPITVSFSAIKNFQNKTGKSIAEFSDDMEDAFALFYYSYVAGCKTLKNQGFKVRYEFDEFDPVFDELAKQFIDVVPDFFPDQKKD